jgi:hypothetical protein
MSDQTALVLLTLLIVVMIFLGLLIMVMPRVRDSPVRRRNALIALIVCVPAGLIIMLANVGLNAIMP